VSSVSVANVYMDKGGVATIRDAEPENLFDAHTRSLAVKDVDADELTRNSWSARGAALTAKDADADDQVRSSWSARMIPSQ
jgi:hypothetical protein